MKLYRILLGEPCSSDYSTCITRYFRNDVAAIAGARRAMRLVNFWNDVPGGQWPVFSRARIDQCGIWPDGDRFVRRVRCSQRRRQQ